MLLRSFITLIFVISAFVKSSSQTEIITYPSQQTEFSAKSEHFLVTLFKSEKDKKGFDSYVYVSKAGDQNLPELGHLAGKTFNYTIFSFSGTVIVEVTKLHSNATNAIIRPNRLKIGTIATEQSQAGKKIRFTLHEAEKVSVEFNDDSTLKDAIVIFANPKEDVTDVPSSSLSNVLTVTNPDDIKDIPSSKTVIFFPAGVFEIGYWNVPFSVQQVYVSGGAFIRGYLFADRNKASSLKINGRGILSGDIYPFHYPANGRKEGPGYFGQSQQFYKLINVVGGSDNVIDGLTMVDATAFNIGFATKNSTVKNTNIVSFRYSTDAITVIGNNNTILNCFFFMNEDAIVLSGNSTSITDCIFWEHENGIMINLGWYTHNISGKNIVDKCDIMHANWAGENSGNVGFIAAMMGSSKFSKDTSAFIENFEISNINADTYIEKFININPESKWLKRDSAIIPWTFRNFNIHDIHLKVRPEKQESVNYLKSFDTSHPIQNFNFSNIYINEKKVESSDAKQPLLFLNREAVKTIKVE